MGGEVGRLDGSLGKNGMDDGGMDIPSRIIRNTLFNAGARVWGVVVALFMSPYIIGSIGAERYGIWAVIAMVTGYFGLLDLGVETAFVKYIAEFHTGKDYRRINELVSTGMVFYALLMLLLLSVMALTVAPIFAFLKVPAAARGEATTVFWIGAVIFCLTNILSPLIAIQNGLQRMDLFNKVSVCMSALTVAATVFFLEKGYGLTGLVFANAAVFCCSAAAHVLLAFRIFPQLRLDPRLFRKEELVRLLKYGYKLQLSRFANLVSFQADNLLISHFLGVGLVTYYQLGTGVIQQARQLLLLLISALIPAVSELVARNDLLRLGDLYLRGSRYLVSLSLPMAAFLILEAPLIMRCWMGPGYKSSVLVIRILAVGYCAATVTGVASSIAAGAGLTELDMKFGLLMSSMNLLLGVALIMVWGLPGVLVATAASLTLSSCYFMRLFHQRVELFPLRRFVQLFRTPALCCLLPSLALAGANLVLEGGRLPQGRIGAGCYLAAQGALFALCYCAGLLRSCYFDDYDQKLLRQRIASLRSMLPYAA